jgi:multidrug efflux pump subunit AcrB
MDWFEIIHLRSHSHGDKENALTAFHHLSQPVRKLLAIDFQMISLGALILALGMLVDNAIVVTEGILVRVQQGMRRMTAAVETVAQTAWPLLGATFVAIPAFAAIGTSQDTTGEFLKSLFLVMAISLGLNWVLAITLTRCSAFSFCPNPKKMSNPIHTPEDSTKAAVKS